MHRARLRTPLNRTSTERIAAFFDRFCATYRMPRAVANAAGLSLDEIVSNIAKHAYAGRPGEIAVDVRLDGRELVILIEDKGPPFDPTKLAPPDLGEALATRLPGGLGILFVKNVMDRMSYERRGAINRLRLVKRLKS